MERFKKLLNEYRAACQNVGRLKEHGRSALALGEAEHKAQGLAAKLCRMFVEDWDRGLPESAICAKCAGTFNAVFMLCPKCRHPRGRAFPFPLPEPEP